MRNIIIPNQPVKMSYCDQTGCNQKEDKCQPARFDDDFYVQIGVINSNPSYDVEIRDCCDNLFLSIGESDVSYPCSDLADIGLKWSDYLSIPGKYKICVPGVETVKDYEFAVFTGIWEQSGSGQSWVSGGINDVSLTDLDAGDRSKILYQLNDIKCLSTLTVNVGGAPGTDGILHFYINNKEIAIVNFSSSSLIDLGSISAISQYPYDIHSIGFQVESVLNGSDYVLLFISNEQDICSNCFCIENTQDCTVLIDAKNNNDAFGLVFSAGQEFHLRIEAELLNLKNEISEAVLEGNDGTTQLYYDKFRNLKDLKVYSEPEYIWNALEMMLGCTDFKLNKTSYTKKEGNIELTFNRTLGEYSGAVIVGEKTQYFKNYF